MAIGVRELPTLAAMVCNITVGRMGFSSSTIENTTMVTAQSDECDIIRNQYRAKNVTPIKVADTCLFVRTLRTRCGKTIEQGNLSEHG